MISKYFHSPTTKKHLFGSCVQISLVVTSIVGIDQSCHKQRKRAGEIVQVCFSSTKQCSYLEGKSV